MWNLDVNEIFCSRWGKRKTGFCSVVSGSMETTGGNPVLFGKSLYSVAKVRTTGRKMKGNVLFHTIL